MSFEFKNAYDNKIYHILYERGIFLMSPDKFEITKDMIVNEVINKYPETDKIFTRYGVDMCCGGVQSIEKQR